MSINNLPNGLRQHYADAPNNERLRIDDIARSVRHARRRAFANWQLFLLCEADRVNRLMRLLDGIRRDAERIDEPYPTRCMDDIQRDAECIDESFPESIELFGPI